MVSFVAQNKVKSVRQWFRSSRAKKATHYNLYEEGEKAYLIQRNTAEPMESHECGAPVACARRKYRHPTMDVKLHTFCIRHWNERVHTPAIASSGECNERNKAMPHMWCLNHDAPSARNRSHLLLWAFSSIFIVLSHCKHDVSSSVRFFWLHPKISPMMWTTRFDACLAASLSMYANRVLRASTSIAVKAYSCSTANFTSASKYGYLVLIRRTSPVLEMYFLSNTSLPGRVISAICRARAETEEQ